MHTSDVTGKFNRMEITRDHEHDICATDGRRNQIGCCLPVKLLVVEQKVHLEQGCQRNIIESLASSARSHGL